MAQNASFNLADSQSTPVNYVFRPKQVENGVQFYIADRAHASYLAAMAGLPTAKPQISVSLREGSAGNAVTRVSRVKRKVVMKLTIPDAWSSVANDGDPVVDTVEATVTIALPLDAQSRAVTDIVKMVGLMLNATPLREVVDGDFPY